MNKQLIEVQRELKAPKGQYNSFGKYKYRSAEDILEAVKPVLYKHNASLYLFDEVEAIGERYYVKATAVFESEDGARTVTAYAREDESKKGMDGSQITGCSSSYARKYALNGLFLIDDTKDADTDDYKRQNEMALEPIGDREASVVKTLLEETGSDVKKFLQYFGVKSVDEMSQSQYGEACRMLNKKKGK